MVRLESNKEEEEDEANRGSMATKWKAFRSGDSRTQPRTSIVNIVGSTVNLVGSILTSAGSLERLR